MVNKEYRRARMAVPWPLRLRRMLRWGFLVPTVVLIPLLLGYLRDEGLGADRFLGLVEAEAETVGTIGTVRILSIDVQPGQRVEPGDVLVHLDPAGPALDLAVQEARLLDYEQSAARYRQTLQESERRSRQIVQESAVALESERMNRARDEAEFSGLQAELFRLQPLVDKRLVSEIELTALRPKLVALEQTVQHYDPLIQALEQRHQQALSDLNEVRGLMADAAVAATSNVPSLRTARKSTTGEPSVLRASRAGIVSRIQYQAGDVVVAGEAIVRVTAEHSRHVTGMMTLMQVRQVALGDRLWLIRQTDPDALPLTAEVEAIDPEIMDLLDPFNPAPRFPIRGRRIRLRVIEENAGLVPGETVVISLRPSGFRLRDFCVFGRE